MNYWFLYDQSGEIYGSPYLGIAEKWDNVPDGCAVLGPIDAVVASEDVKAASINPEYYRVTDGMLIRKSVGEIQDIDNARPLPQPSQADILGQQVADLTLQNMQLNSTVDTLGAMAAQSQLDIMALKGGAS